MNNIKNTRNETAIEIPSSDPVNILEGVSNILTNDTFLSILGLVVSAGISITLKTLSKNKKNIEKIISKLNYIEQTGEDEILPAEYIKRINQIMAQIGILGEYDRVVLGILHNGVVGSRYSGSRYSKFEKIAILCSYTVSGIEELPEFGKDLDLSIIDADLTLLKENDNNLCVDTRQTDSLDSKCFIYLKERNIQNMQNILLNKNDLDLGILSLQRCSGKSVVVNDDRKKTIEELINEVSSIIDVYAKTNKKIRS